MRQLPALNSDEGSILLLHCDSAFNETMADVATNLRVPLAVHASADEAITQTAMRYGAIIVDWDSGAGKAIAAIKRLEKRFGVIPVLLIGQDTDSDLITQAWPDSVKGFLAKGRGFRAILDSAIGLIRMEID